MLQQAKQPAFWNKIRTAEEYALFRDDLLAMYKKIHSNATPAVSYRQYTRYYQDGNRLEFEQAYFSKRIRMNILALLALIYPQEPAYIDELKEVIWAVCDEYTWALPAHVPFDRWDHSTLIDLFSSETGFALSEIRELLGNRLGALIYRRIGTEIERRIIQPFLTENFFWEQAENNWCAVCTCGVAAAFFYIRPELAKSQISRFNDNLQAFLRSFQPDGVCREGVGYWNYGFGFFVSYASMLQEFTNGEINLFSNDKVRRIASFQHKAYLRDDITASFADGNVRSRHIIGITHFLKHLYPDDIKVLPTRFRENRPLDISDVAFRARWTFELRSILWYDPALSTEKAETTAEYYLSDSAWYIKKTPDYSFAAKAGNNDEPHNHNDIGSFIFATDQGQLLCDLGCGEYTRDYFQPGTRYRILCNRSGGHSVPLIDGQEQKPGAEFDGTMSLQNGILTLEMSHAYAISELLSLQRQFSFQENGVTLWDKFSFRNAPLSVIERFITQVCPEEEGSSLRIGQALLTCGAAWAPVVTPAVWANHIGQNETVYLIDFLAKKPTDTFQLSIQLQP